MSFYALTKELFLQEEKSWQKGLLTLFCFKSLARKSTLHSLNQKYQDVKNLSWSKIVELTIIRISAEQNICGSSIERIAFAMNQIRGNIKEMIRDDLISILFGDTIHHIFPYNQKYPFGYLFDLVFIVFFFRHCPQILSSNVFISVYSFCFKILHSFINEAVVWSQIFHSFRRGKHPH